MDVGGRGVEVGAGVGVGNGVAVGPGVGLGVGDGLDIGSGVAVGVGGIGVAVGAISGVAVGGTVVAKGVLVDNGRGVGPGRSTVAVVCGTSAVFPEHATTTAPIKIPGSRANTLIRRTTSLQLV